jgi:membrane protease YdiL (CAAX protease family)
MTNKLTVIFIATLFCVLFTGVFIALSFSKNLFPASFERLSHGLIGTIAAFSVTLLFLKFDKKRFSDVELYFNKNTVRKFLVGILIGIVLMGLLATGVMYFTHVSIEPNQKANVFRFFIMTTPLIPLAFMEELGFRAYPLQILKNKLGIRLSIVITSILFALYHLANGWTIASSFFGPAVWGLLFGLAAVYSKGIAMPTGIHYAVNLTTSAFGADENSIALWTVKQTNISTSIYQGIDLAIVLPSLAILMIALIGIELYMRRKTTTNIALPKAGLTQYN